MTRHAFAEPRCYTLAAARAKLQLSRSTFFAMRKAGQLPLIELLPRLGRSPRYHALPIDRYLAGRGIARRAWAASVGLGSDGHARRIG